MAILFTSWLPSGPDAGLSGRKPPKAPNDGGFWKVATGGKDPRKDILPRKGGRDVTPEIIRLGKCMKDLKTTVDPIERERLETTIFALAEIIDRHGPA
jgi:hypothetical protein